MSGEDEMLLGREGGLATLVINRPQALNALTLDNYRRFAPALRAWAADPSIHAVVVRGAGERAFCAGGDVRAVYEAYRIATERTLFAMPETAIGLFPDVGATRFLNRCPGHVGRYLGLTGARLQAADALYCGFATNAVPHDRVAELVEALGRIAWEPGSEQDQVDELLARFAVDPGSAPLAALQPAIDRCFAGGSVEAIIAALAAEAAAGAAHARWAAETRAGLLTKSPTSLKITLRQLTIGRDYEIEAALALEYRLTQHVMAAHDFYKGVRAMLIDKDQKPRWHPATLAEVSDSLVDAYFVPIGDRELRLA